MHCLDRAVLVAVVGMLLKMHCLHRAVLVPVFGVPLQMYMYCLNRAALVPVSGGGNRNPALVSAVFCGSSAGGGKPNKTGKNSAMSEMR